VENARYGRAGSSRKSVHWHNDGAGTPEPTFAGDDGTASLALLRSSAGCSEKGESRRGRQGKGFGGGVTGKGAGVVSRGGYLQRRMMQARRADEAKWGPTPHGDDGQETALVACFGSGCRKLI